MMFDADRAVNVAEATVAPVPAVLVWLKLYVPAPPVVPDTCPVMTTAVGVVKVPPVIVPKVMPV